MRKLICTLFSGLLLTSVWAQTERVYVVTDRTAYLSGDRVWCSLFCMDQNGLPSLKSAVAYLELVSAEGTGAEAKIALLQGRGCGEFTLPPQLPTGNYRLMAYTALEGGDAAQMGSRLLSIYNPFSVARVKEGVVAQESPVKSILEPETGQGIELHVPARIRAEKPFSVALTGTASDLTLSVFHVDGLEQVPVATLDAFLKDFPVSANGAAPWEYDGEVIGGTVSGAPVESIAILSSAGSPDDTYFTRVEEDGSVRFATGNIYGDREMVCAVPEAGEHVRIRLESPYQHPEGKDLPILCLHDSQFEALVSRKSALSTLYGADTLYTFLPRREDLLLSGVSWERYHLDDYTRFNSVQEIVVEILPGVRLRKGRFEVSVADGSKTTRRFRENVLVMMDGVVIPDMQMLLNLDAMLLDDVYVCAEPIISGYLTYDGIVNFVSKKNYVKTLNFPENVYVLDFKGVRYPLAYLGKVPGGKDLRQLLYWHPALTMKAGETVRIPLVSPAYTGKFCVIAEGLSATGEAVRAVRYFEVE